MENVLDPLKLPNLIGQNYGIELFVLWGRGCSVRFPRKWSMHSFLLHLPKFYGTQSSSDINFNARFVPSRKVMPPSRVTSLDWWSSKMSITSCLPASLCHCEGKQQSEDKNSFTCVMQFLMGLNDSYDQSVIKFLWWIHYPLWIELTPCCWAWRDSVRFTSYILTKLKPQLCFWNNNFKTRVNKSQSGGKWIRKEKCAYCHIDGHSMEQCYKLHGFPDWSKGRKEVKQSSGLREEFTRDRTTTYGTTTYGKHRIFYQFCRDASIFSKHMIWF